MMTRQREAVSARAARAAARDRLRDRAARGGLVAKARRIAAAAGDALRAVRRGFGRGAACVAPASRAPSQAETSADGAQADGVLADDPAAARKVVLRLVPPPALAAVAQQPFDFEGAPFQASASEEGICVRLAEQAEASTLLQCCAAWLRVPAETITIRGAARPLTMASQRRTLAQAGLSARALRRRLPDQRAEAGPSAATLHVAVAPWCCICLAPARRGRVWSCAAQHACCHGCARRYAESAAVLRASVAHSWLRCPAAGCSFELAQGAAMHSLLSFKAMARLRASRAAAQAVRLSSARAGREVRLGISHALP